MAVLAEHPGLVLLVALLALLALAESSRGGG
jgi:hypothetical protein